jgi:hypothetical protein
MDEGKPVPQFPRILVIQGRPEEQPEKSPEE